jgi:hypothetical protein
MNLVTNCDHCPGFARFVGRASAIPNHPATQFYQCSECRKLSYRNKQELRRHDPSSMMACTEHALGLCAEQS